MATLLLTFANCEQNRLDALTRECDGVNEALQERFADGDFVVISEPLATRYKIADLIRAHEENIKLFLFSGHAGSDQLMLEDGAGLLDGVVGLLSKCTKLELVILNGCSTAGRVKMMLDSGIPIVIATSTSVSDEAATQFSIAFFEELSQKRKSIREAFERAMVAAKVFGQIEEEERSTRGLGLEEDDEKPLWGLYYNESDKELLDSWRLPEMQPVTSTTQTGRIVHNIPAKMKKANRLICKVRIAKDDEKLLKNFKLPDGRTPETLEISKTMEVELVDADGDVFKIDYVLPGKSNAEQPIVGHTYTEWMFGITPLREGDHTLLLCAYFIEKIDGEKTKRSLSFERQVTVTTEVVENEITPQWHLTRITTRGKEEKKKRAGFAGWVTTYAKPLMAAAVLLISTIFVLNMYNSKEKRYGMSGVSATTTMEPTLSADSPILLLNDSLMVDSIFVNGALVTEWVAGDDTTEITLSGITLLKQTADTLNIFIKAKNGEYRKSVVVSGENPVIQMDSFTLPVQSISVGITAPIDATVSIDGEKKFDPRRQRPNELEILPIRIPNSSLHTLTFKLEKGTHTFSMSGLSRYKCPQSQLKVEIERDTVLDFNCTPIQYIVTLKTPFKPVVIFVDGKVVEPEPTKVKELAQPVTELQLKINRNPSYESSIKVDKGSHLFQVTTPREVGCAENPKRVNVQSDRTIDFGCNPVIR